MSQSVLIVDDHEPFRRVVGELLRDSGHHVVAAGLTAGGDGPAIVLTSADPEPDYEALAVRAGARRFVAKADLATLALHDLWR